MMGPMIENSTITQRMIWDVLECNPTFHKDDRGEVLWADRDGVTYKVDMRIPGISAEQADGWKSL